MNMSVASCTSFNTQISNIVFPHVKTRVELGFFIHFILSSTIFCIVAPKYTLSPANTFSIQSDISSLHTFNRGGTKENFAILK